MTFGNGCLTVRIFHLSRTLASVDIALDCVGLRCSRNGLDKDFSSWTVVYYVDLVRPVLINIKILSLLIQSFCLQSVLCPADDLRLPVIYIVRPTRPAIVNRISQQCITSQLFKFDPISESRSMRVPGFSGPAWKRWVCMQPREF